MHKQRASLTGRRFSFFSRKRDHGKYATASMWAIMLLLGLGGCGTSLDALLYQATNATTRAFFDSWLTQTMNAVAGLLPLG
jgi:hypothetical protein